MSHETRRLNLRGSTHLYLYARETDLWLNMVWGRGRSCRFMSCGLSVRSALVNPCVAQYHSYGLRVKGTKLTSRIRLFNLYLISESIDNSRTGLDTSKNQCSTPAVTALKNYWRYHVYNLFLLKNSSNVFAFIIIIIGCLTGNIIHDQLKLRPCFLPWVSKNRRYLPNT